MKLETKEEYLVDSAIEMLYPTVTFNSYEAAVKHIHETPGTWRITKIYRTLPVGEEVTDVRGLRGRSAQAVEESGVATILVGVVRVVQQLDVSRVTRINKGYLSLSGAFSHKKTMR